MHTFTIRMCDKKSANLVDGFVYYKLILIFWVNYSFTFLNHPIHLWLLDKGFVNTFYRNCTHEDCRLVQYPLRQWTTIQQCVHTEFVPRICRLGLSASRSFRTIFRKLSTNRLILWQWQAISSWSRASIAIHTYLWKQTHAEYG